MLLKYYVLYSYLKDRNPVDSIKFFSKYNPDKICQIGKELVSGLLPTCYLEITCRIFSKNPDKCAAIQIAFRNLIKTINHSISIPTDEELCAQSQELNPTSSPSGPAKDEMNNLFYTPKASPSKSSLRYNHAL